jgi:hypothetical protein
VGIDPKLGSCTRPYAPRATATKAPTTSGTRSFVALGAVPGDGALELEAAWLMARIVLAEGARGKG